MKVLITGSNGFIARHLRLRFSERKDVEVLCFGRGDDPVQLPALLQNVDFVFHLAGVNRPQDPTEFAVGNIELTEMLCGALGDMTKRTGKKVPLVFTSSTQAERDNPYGVSKLRAEQAVFAAAKQYGFPAYVFRLPNVFGKWCKPNYNSAVATFCHNVARGLPIQIHDPVVLMTMVYVDDLVDRFVELLEGAESVSDAHGFEVVTPQYDITVGDLAGLIQSFKASRQTLMSERVGTGLLRALYSTYVSYLPVDAFSYTVPMHSDARGVFVEMLKTPDCGQFSYFTAHPGVTRGGHYHHSKTEKFLVIKGQAKFRFRHMLTGETHELVTCGDRAEIVETVPGWTHDITNSGEDEMVVMLWANEIFDRAKPDTYTCPV